MTLGIPLVPFPSNRLSLKVLPPVYSSPSPATNFHFKRFRFCPWGFMQGPLSRMLLMYSFVHRSNWSVLCFPPLSPAQTLAPFPDFILVSQTLRPVSIRGRQFRSLVPARDSSAFSCLPFFMILTAAATLRLMFRLFYQQIGVGHRLLSPPPIATLFRIPAASFHVFLSARLLPPSSLFRWMLLGVLRILTSMP